MSDVTEQIELAFRAASSQADRALFIADPKEYAESLGVEINPGFASHMRDRFLEIEGQLSKQGYRNTILERLKIGVKDPGWTDPVPDSLVINPADVGRVANVVAVAAVVSAVASVVSAASTTYMATNWLIQEKGLDVAVNPQLTGVRDLMANQPFLRPDMRAITRGLKTPGGK